MENQKEEKLVHIATYEETCKELGSVLKSKKRVVIRLGGTMEYSKYPIQINSVDAVKSSTDKIRMKLLFLQNGIPTTNIGKMDKLPVVVKGLKRSQGTGVTIAKTKSQLIKAIERIKEKCKGYYLEEYFPATREFRLHVSSWGGVFFEVEKIKDEGAQEVIKYGNHHNVRFFTRPSNWKKIQEACVKALECQGLDLAAYDVGYAQDGSFTIYESNTGPELLTNTFNKYKEELQKKIDIENAKV